MTMKKDPPSTALNTIENFGCDLVARKLKPCGGQQEKTTSPEKNLMAMKLAKNQQVIKSLVSSG